MLHAKGHDEAEIKKAPDFLQGEQFEIVITNSLHKIYALEELELFENLDSQTVATTVKLTLKKKFTIFFAENLSSENQTKCKVLIANCETGDWICGYVTSWMLRVLCTHHSSQSKFNHAINN
jgi:hypothetical protein